MKTSLVSRRAGPGQITLAPARTRQCYNIKSKTMYFYGGGQTQTRCYMTSKYNCTRQLFDRAARTSKCFEILTYLARERTNKRTPLKAHWLLDSQTQCAAGIHQVWMKRYFSTQFKLLLSSMMPFNQAWGQAHVLVLILGASAFAIPKQQCALRASPAYLSREKLGIFDSLEKVVKVSLVGDVCEQAGFLVCAVFGYRRGDIHLPSFLATMNSMGELVDSFS